MNLFLNSIQERIVLLEDIISNAKRDLRKAPKGNLKICKSPTRTQYYLRTDNNCSTGTYIPKGKRQLAADIAQRDYLEKIICTSEVELHQLLNLQKKLKNSQPESVFPNLSEARKELVSPLFIPEDDFIKQWSQRDYEKKPFPDDYPEYYTHKGERVRSKSEIILADTFYNMDIPYHYEHPIKLDRITYYPDFLVLNKRTQQEFIWEHLGMMDNPIYAENVVKKINDYCKHGYFPGVNLILSWETSNNPLNIPIIKREIEAYLI